MKTQSIEQTGATDELDANRSFIRKENLGASTVWGSGGRRYDRISAQIADAIGHGVDSLNPKPQEEVLDVATQIKCLIKTPDDLREGRGLLAGCESESTSCGK